MKSLEDNLQAQCVQWFRLQYPDVLICSIPNADKRNVTTAARMKRTGLLAGIPDLFVAKSFSVPVVEGWKTVFHGLFIELKIGKNKLTESQKLVHEKLISEGYCVKVCYTFDEFINVVKDYIGE